jgi:hypothetical protein
MNRRGCLVVKRARVLDVSSEFEVEVRVESAVGELDEVFGCQLDNKRDFSLTIINLLSVQGSYA